MSTYSGCSARSQENYVLGEGWSDHPMAQQGWVINRGWTESSSGVNNMTGEAWSFTPKSSDYLGSRYLAAFYDACTDMIIEKANNDPELVVGILAHFLYECLYGFILGTLTSIVMESRKSRQEYEEKITTVLGLPRAVKRPSRFP